MLNRCDYCHEEIEWLQCNCTTAKAIRENKDRHNSSLESRVRELEAENAELKLQISPLSSATPSYVAGLEAERDRLKSCLYGLLEALQAKHIDELIAKSPEHLIKFGEVVKDSYQEKAAEVYKLQAENEMLDGEVKRNIEQIKFAETDAEDARKELKKLRARHAALVEKLEHDLHDIACVLASYKLKAALAEVKGGIINV